MHELRESNPFTVIIGHININSVRNKFESPEEMIKDNVDILLVLETKLDDTFPRGQFCIDGHSTPYRLDRTSHGSGILFHIREDISSKMLKFEPVQTYFEGFLVEMNLRKSKWFLSCSYNPNRKDIVNHVKNISTEFDQISTTYDNLTLIGDLNVETEEDNMLDFLNIRNLKNLVKQKTCYKNPESPSCIDLILTNCHRGFQNTNVFETGLSVFLFLNHIFKTLILFLTATIKDSVTTHIELNLIMSC